MILVITLNINVPSPSIKGQIVMLDTKQDPTTCSLQEMYFNNNNTVMSGWLSGLRHQAQNNNTDKLKEKG